MSPLTGTDPTGGTHGVGAPSVDEILDQRRHRNERRGDRLAAAGAVALHALAITAAVLLPLLTAAPPSRPRIVPVRLVPAQRQGRLDAPAEPPRPTRPRPPEPKPEPVRPPEPKPEPVRAETEPTPPPTEPTRTEPTAPTAEPEPSQPETGRRGSPEGNPLGTTAFGARLEGVDPGFTYDSYLQRMLARIESEWRRPSMHTEVEAMVHFVVGRDGTVRDLRVVQSSDVASFDLAAVRAVQNASPLPPLPRSYRKDELGVNLIVR